MQTRFRHFIINLILVWFIGFPFLHANTDTKMKMEVLQLKEQIIDNLDNDFKELKKDTPMTNSKVL